MVKQQHSPEEWETAVLHGHLANSARDNWLKLDAIATRIEQLGFVSYAGVSPRQRADHQKREYLRHSDIVGLAVGPASQQYEDSVGLEELQQQVRASGMIQYFIGARPTFIDAPRE